MPKVGSIATVEIVCGPDAPEITGDLIYLTTERMVSRMKHDDHFREMARQAIRHTILWLDEKGYREQADSLRRELESMG